MSGLLLKDLLLVKKQGKIYLLLAVFYGILALTGMVNSSFFAGLVALFMMLLPVSSFSYDELAHWDKYAATLPAGRVGIVRAKYLFCLCILAVSLGGISLVNLLLCVTRGTPGELPEALLAGLACGLVGLLFNSILLPIVLRFGAEKSRVVMLLFTIVIFAGLYGGISLLKGQGVVPSVPPNWMLAVLLPMLIVLPFLAFALSYRISLRIYLRKEL